MCTYQKTVSGNITPSISVSKNLQKYCVLDCTTLISMFTVAALAQKNKPVIDEINAGVGISGHFFLRKGGGKPISGAPQGAQQSTEGKGISFPILFRKDKYGLTYEPTLRYDIIRINLRVPTGSPGPEEFKEWIIDHHFALTRRFDGTFIGVGYSIFTPGKGYDWTYRVFLNGLSQPSTEISRYLKLRVNTYDVIIGRKFRSNVVITSKLMYAPVGSIKWGPYLSGILFNLSVHYSFRIH